MNMNSIGIDIGSTCAKVAVLDDTGTVVYTMLMPTGWSSVDTAADIKSKLEAKGFDVASSPVIATGYGRVAVPYASKAVTEITCHAAGAAKIFGISDALVIDIGGQDTKIIAISNKSVKDFIMNDKCSAGTGRFLEVMATRLGMRTAELCEFARNGSGVKISSMCTVFAESEVISMTGRGESKENIAFAIVESITEKVASQAARLFDENVPAVLTGGLCECSYLIESLGQKLATNIITCAQARFAGAIGAALICGKEK